MRPSLPFTTFSRFHSTTAFFNPNLHLHLQHAINQPCLQLTKKLHGQIHSLGLSQDSFLAAKLITSYSLSNSPADSLNVFKSIQHKNIFLYNSLLNGYVKNRNFKDPFVLFKQMRDVIISPDNYTLSTLMKACSEIGDLGIGEMVHCVSLKIGFFSDTVLGNSVMVMYRKCGSFRDVRKVFDEIPERNSASWNVLISGAGGLGSHGFSEGVGSLVRKMQLEGVRMDAFTVSSLLPLCRFGKGEWDHGREIHCVIVKNEMNVDSDVHVGTCLIDMYARRKNVSMSMRVFERMTCRNVVAWTSIMLAYVQNGCLENAFMLFRDMQLRDDIEPNRVSIISVLPACNSLGVLREGKQIHGFCVRKEYSSEVSLSNALIDMYSKCGNLDYARRIFGNDSFCKDNISWSSMISGYGLNGKGFEAVSLYREMIQLGIKPDSVTLVSVLSGCAKSGMFAEGLDIYHSAINVYGVSPTAEICGCMVDMLGRSGQVNKALEFIKTMPVKPGASVWGSLFGASVVHENSDMQELAYRSLIQLEPENPSNYVSLSNVYASLKRWDVVAELRKKMRGRGLRKMPGCSWININNETHSFYVADTKHPCSDLLYELLDDLKIIMKVSQSIPDFETLM